MDFTEPVNDEDYHLPEEFADKVNEWLVNVWISLFFYINKLNQHSSHIVSCQYYESYSSVIIEESLES